MGDLSERHHIKVLVSILMMDATTSLVSASCLGTATRDLDSDCIVEVLKVVRIRPGMRISRHVLSLLVIHLITLQRKSTYHQMIRVIVLSHVASKSTTNMLMKMVNSMLSRQHRYR
jgi:hypothetical protein